MERLLFEYSFKNATRLFYVRRLKRIFPNYFISIFYAISLGHLIFHFADLQYLKNDAKWAIIFASNLKPIIEEHNYFKMVMILQNQIFQIVTIFLHVLKYIIN